MPRNLLFVFASCLLSVNLFAQSITVTGRVTDMETEKGISFATIYIKGTDINISTDFDGYYKIDLKPTAEYIGAKCIGYDRVITAIKKHTKIQTIDFELEPVDTISNGASLRKSEAAALSIVRNVIIHKSSHDKKTLNSYGYEAYTKIQIDLVDLNEKFKKRKIFKPFQFVFKNIDSTSEVKPFLPFFLTETVSDFYHKRGMLTNREFIKASKVSGVDDLSISQFLGTSTLETDIYNDYIVLLRRQFISPVSPLGLDCYIYYLEDSQTINGYKCHKIRFIPRSQQLAQLEGEMWIADGYYAVKSIRIKMQNNSKLNPIHSISLYDEFIPVDSSIWMLKKQILGVNAIKFKNTPEMTLRRSVYYDRFVINAKKHVLDSIFKKGKPEIAISDSAKSKNEAYWQEIRRKAALGVHEDKVYNMIDTLSNLKITKNYINAFQTVFLGYVDVGPLSIGNIYSFVALNHVQGWRFKYGMRTNSSFSKVVRIGAYGGYGIRDHLGVYGADVLWLIKKDPRMSIDASYRFDLTSSRNYNSFYITPDFWTTYGLRRIENGHFIPLKLMQMREFKLKFYHEFKFGYSYTVGILNQRLQPVSNFNFSYHTAADNSNPNTDIISGTVTELSLTQRFAWHERFVNSNFLHVGFGSKLPILTLQVAVGVKSILGSQFNYQRLAATIRDTRFLGLVGKLKYDIEAGKIFGTMPFIFLQTPDASETYLSVWPRFNTISQYQFAADRYVQVMAEHHLEGLLLDRIPGVKKLRLREVWGAHMWWGDMTAANQTANYANLSSNPLNTGLVKVQVADRKPFIEMNAGIENIFSFFRIDAVWRATYLDPRGTRFSFRYGNCGVRLSFAFQF